MALHMSYCITFRILDKQNIAVLLLFYALGVVKIRKLVCGAACIKTLLLNGNDLSFSSFRCSVCNQFKNTGKWCCIFRNNVPMR